jgi:hypothetical protein
VVARLFIVGVAWLAAVVLFAALLEWSGSTPAYLDARHDGVTALARSLNGLRPPSAGDRHEWTVTKATSALHSLVVEIEAIDPTQARHIAEHLIAQVRGSYDQVLIYVQPVDAAGDAFIHRIEWTPRGGYLASGF